jgi:hypothetical protein
MGRYVYYHEVHREKEFPELFYAQKTPGVSGEVANMGCYTDDSLIKQLKADAPPGMDDRTGGMIQHTLTTPVIEIAGDGKTAKGIWISPGHETGPNRRTGTLQGQWAWCKYGCDFVKEDGRWRLWHYHVYATFITPYDTDWVNTPQSGTQPAGPPEGGEPPPGPGPMGDMPQPNVPTTYHNPYSKDYVAEMVPAPPLPYETFDDTFSYGP